MKYIYLCASAGGIFIVNFQGGGLDRFFCEAFCHERNDRRKIMQNAPFNEDDHCVLMSHVTHMDEWVMSHIWMNENRSFHAHNWMSLNTMWYASLSVFQLSHQCDVHQCGMHHIDYSNSIINVIYVSHPLFQLIHQCDVHQCDTHEIKYFNSFINVMCINVMLWYVSHPVFKLIHQCDVHQCNMHEIKYFNSFINVMCITVICINVVCITSSIPTHSAMNTMWYALFNEYDHCTWTSHVTCMDEWVVSHV